MSGSCELGDFVVLGGQVGLADHVKIGDGARLAARSAVGVRANCLADRTMAVCQHYPVREWRRQMAAFAMLGRAKAECKRIAARQPLWMWIKSRNCCRIARPFFSSNA